MVCSEKWSARSQILEACFFHSLFMMRERLACKLRAHNLWPDRCRLEYWQEGCKFLATWSACTQSGLRVQWRTPVYWMSRSWLTAVKRLLSPPLQFTSEEIVFPLFVNSDGLLRSARRKRKGVILPGEGLW